jgi:hypothetical protein
MALAGQPLPSDKRLKMDGASDDVSAGAIGTFGGGELTSAPQNVRDLSSAVEEDDGPSRS